MEGVTTVSICWIGSKMGARALPHDFWVAPGGFDLEGSTAFFEPGTPLIALVVLELELFVAPYERGTSLRARINGSGVRKREKRENRGHKNQRKTYGSGQVSQLPVPIPPGVNKEYSYWYSSRDLEGQRHSGWYQAGRENESGVHTLIL